MHINSRMMHTSCPNGSAVEWRCQTKSPLRILHLEDDPHDTELVHSMLEAEGVACSMTRVETRADFVAALERDDFELIISDFSLPAFDGLSALEMTQAKRPEVPFILVSGTLGEELAIESLKSGATDYVLKGRLSRLAPAVRRAMQEVELCAERKRLEAQFIQAQKMEVIGQLAGGVAHDFNNVLAIILGYSDVIMRSLKPNDPSHQHAEAIRHAAERATALTRQLLVFSRKQKSQPVVLDLNDVVAGMDKMLRQLIDESVELTVIPGKLLGRVKADSGYIGQVLMNLVVNGRDAMPAGGKLIVETRNMTLDQSYTRAHAGVAPGEYVMLAVSDTGVGMSDEVKAHLFEAFFTTKPKGKGTGLGLATCQTIVKQSGGHIGVYSELGRGTTFKVYLPRVDQPLDETARAVAPGALPRGTETILLVEDEPAVSRLAGRVLEAQGYTVLRAANGEDGLLVAREHKGAPISLVVTDVVMPQMGGKAMAEWLQTTNPGLKTLFTSGYTDDAIAHHGVLDPGVAFLPKPYTPATLTQKVRELLDQKGGGRTEQRSGK
jgi:two-component system cell cycle sensor histidine kinase/response regulator CckA